MLPSSGRLLWQTLFFLLADGVTGVAERLQGHDKMHQPCLTARQAALQPLVPRCQDSRLVISSLTPGPVQCAGDTLFVHGGHGNFILGDLFALDLVTMQWKELGLMGSPKLQGHTLNVHGDHLWACGGVDEDGSPSTRLWRLDLKRCLSQRTSTRCACVQRPSVTVAGSECIAGHVGPFCDCRGETMLHICE